MKFRSGAESISWFQDQYRGGKLTLRPPFQRKPVWTDKHRSALIESILMNLPIPEVYVQVTHDDEGREHFGVVDGQQRLRTILQFGGLESATDQHGGEDVNNFALDALPANSPYAGKTFAGISSSQRKKFFQYEVCVRYLYTDNERDVEEVFKRINKYVLQLKPQELRNATYHGPFAKLSEELANDEYWAVNKIVSAAQIRRMTDIEMMSDLLIGLIHGPQGGSAKVIDEYYEWYEDSEDDSFPEQGRIRRLFDRTLDTVQRLFPTIREVPRWGNRADFYSLFVALGSQLESHEIRNERTLVEDLTKFAADVDRGLKRSTARVSDEVRQYARAIEKGVNDKARRQDRHDVLQGLLSPSFKPK